jgi:calcineurin-like phosphoesterase family protein
MISAFFSDPHFGHARILELTGRPFSTIRDHDEYIVERYNAKVAETGVTLWLGDVSFYPLDQTAALVARMHGTKLVVMGNHDRSAAWLARAGFVVVSDVALNIAGRTCRCSHRPYREHDRERDDAESSDYRISTPGRC